MRKTKEVVRLFCEAGLSQRAIALSCGISRPTVADYLARFRASGLAWPLPSDVDDGELERKLFPAPAEEGVAERPLPKFAEIYKALKQKGVTLLQLWEDYRRDHTSGYAYSQFCELYRRWLDRLDITMRQEHRAGEKVFSDFAGSKIPVVVDRRTGEVREAHIFVCALGASNYAYTEAFWSEDSEAWCMGHAHAFRYYGGCPQIIVPDNPTPTVTSPCRYEPDINPDFHHMASYHKMVVIPARVRHPRDKAKAESAVGMATRWVISVLRRQERTFFSLTELNQAIWELLEILNTRPFKKMPGCRRSMFEETDKLVLRSLPAAPYQYTHIKKARVNIDYHVDVEGHWYSVPYQLVRQQVEVHLSYNTVELFFKGRRVASHVRSPIKGRHTTVNEHRPKSHREYLEWSPARIIAWASKTGPATASLIERIMQSRPHPEQGFRSCLGIIRLGRSFGEDRLEAACQRAVKVGAYSYKSVKSILSSGLDRTPLPEERGPVQLTLIHSNIRGPEYYNTCNTKEDNNASSTDNREPESHEAPRHGEGAGGADEHA